MKETHTHGEVVTLVRIAPNGCRGENRFCVLFVEFPCQSRRLQRLSGKLGICFLIRMTRQGRRITMSNPIWNWWFGDVSLSHMAITRSTNRFAVGRRFIVFLAAIGATQGVHPALVFAEDGAIEVKTQQITVGWSPSTSFAMMLAAQAPEEGAEEAQSADTAATDTAATDAEDARDLGRDLEEKLGIDTQESRSEDEDREKRLRELLNDDAPLSDPVTGTELKNVAEEDSAMSPSANEVDPSVKENEGVFAEPFITPRYPEVEQGRFLLPPIRAVSIDQKPIGNGRIPETVSAGDELNMIALPEDGDQRIAFSGEGAWPELIRPWAAPNTFSHPLYFEDRMLERHGHERWGYFQPLASGTRFFVTLPMLPYLATVQPPCDIVYSKGYFRAGSPVPKFRQRPPLERRAIIVEAAAVSGAIIALP